MVQHLVQVLEVVSQVVVILQLEVKDRALHRLKVVARLQGKAKDQAHLELAE
jgi:hypothetical protein